MKKIALITSLGLVSALSSGAATLHAGFHLLGLSFDRESFTVSITGEIGAGLQSDRDGSAARSERDWSHFSALREASLLMSSSAGVNGSANFLSGSFDSFMGEDDGKNSVTEDDTLSFEASSQSTISLADMLSHSNQGYSLGDYLGGDGRAVGFGYEGLSGYGASHYLLQNSWAFDFFHEAAEFHWGWFSSEW